MTETEPLVLTIDEVGDRRAEEEFLAAMAALGAETKISTGSLLTYRIVTAGHRACQMILASAQRYYSTDFWDRGVLYGRFQAVDPAQLAAAVHYFLYQDGTTSGLKGLWPGVDIDEQARAHESGTLVDYAWAKYLSPRYATDQMTEFHHRVFTVAQHTRLRLLMPFTSMDIVRFSTCTGWPYSAECPLIAHLNTWTACRSPWTCSVSPKVGSPPCFTGSIADAVGYAVSILPSVTVARSGTAADDVS